MNAATLIPDRLEAAMDAPLLVGGHDAPPNDDGPPKACLLEMVAWVHNEDWSDHPDCVSPVLGAYGRRLNDRLNDEDRQRLRAFIPRLGGTAGDGQDAARRALAAEWVVKTGLPQWLELVGMTAKADELRSLDTVAQGEELRRLLWKLRDEIREETGVTWLSFRQKVRDEVRKRLEEKGTPVAVAVADAAAAAAAAAVAAAAAAAVAAAAADAAAAAVAVAAAAAAAVAAAAADAAAAAVADADAAAAADFSPDARYDEVYWAVRNNDGVKAAVKKAVPFAEEHREAAFELFEQMIDPKAAE